MDVLERIIYADHELNEIGILQEFEIDVDVAGEKDFEIKVSGNNKVLDRGYYWFIQGMEYGGIVDSIEGDSDEYKIVYRGRNARGILNSKVVQPPNGASYRYVSGKLSDVFNGLLELCSLDDLFIADDSDITISNSQINRYVTLYEAMVALAKKVHSTIRLAYSSEDKRWHIKVGLTRDYSDYLNYCKENAIGYKTKNIFNAVNHLIVLGTGELNERLVIHLFTDENGGVQPYSVKEVPLEDADYILDESMKVMTGLDEYVMTYQAYAAPVANYKNITPIPKNWSSDFQNYYYLDEGGNYAAYEWKNTGEEIFIVLDEEPDDWNENYSAYYERKARMSTYEFVSVSGDTIDNYKLIPHNPFDWNENYGSYYYRFNTGSGYEYRAIEGESRENYIALTSKPDDWEESFSSYYCIEDGEWNSVNAVQIKDEETAPIFRLNKYYRKTRVTSAPDYEEGRYYYNDPITSAPNFDEGTYYRAEEVLLVPEFIDGNTFLSVVDNYAGMVEAGISQLMELRAGQIEELTLDGLDVEIGDVVGGEDSITGYSMCESVTNIIVRIDRYGISYEYYVGGV